MGSSPSTSVVLVARGRGASIAADIADLRAAGDWREILVVDDGSHDDTDSRAEGAGARVIRHSLPKGPGAAVKTGILEATSDNIVIADADGDHRPDDIRRMVAYLEAYELVVGARPPQGQSADGTVGTGLLNSLAGYLTERPIPDLTSGLRAGRRACFLEFLHLVPNGGSASTTTTLAFVKAGYSVRFEPIAVAPKHSSTAGLGAGIISFLLILLQVVTIYSPLRVYLPITAAAFVVGGAYAIWTIATQSHVTNSSVVLILLSVVIFLVGLISEQVASLRFEGHRR